MKEPTWGVKVKAGYGREGNSKGISEERDKFIFLGGWGRGLGLGGRGGSGASTRGDRIWGFAFDPKSSHSHSTQQAATHKSKPPLQT